MSDIVELEKRIRGAIARVQADGWTIANVIRSYDPRRCCPMAAVTGSGVLDAPRALGVSYEWVTAFIAGFDGNPRRTLDADAYDLGVRLRAEFITAAVPR